MSNDMPSAYLLLPLTSSATMPYVHDVPPYPSNPSIVTSYVSPDTFSNSSRSDASPFSSFSWTYTTRTSEPVTFDGSTRAPKVWAFLRISLPRDGNVCPILGSLLLLFASPPSVLFFVVR